MKANELMVGDYLMHNGFPYRVIQVDGIVRDGWMIENGEEDCGEPIPLTLEILEKNGFRIIFEGELHTTYFQDIDGFAIEIKIDCIDFTKLSMSNGLGYRVVTECKYVHQLQHALRLCGINHEIIL